jgi:outer membrane autotransporter protein
VVGAGRWGRSMRAASLIQWRVLNRYALDLRSRSAVFGAAVVCCSLWGAAPAAAACNNQDTSTCPVSTAPASEQTVGTTVNAASQVAVGTFQSYIQDVRAGLQAVAPPGSSQPLGFAAASSDEPGENVLGYGPRTRRAQQDPLNAFAKQAASNPVRYAVWGQVFGDHESRNGAFRGLDTGRTTKTFGGIVGVDAIFTGVNVASDAVVVGILASDFSSKTNNNDGSTSRVEGPSVGIYSAYVMGANSLDAIFKVDFLDINTASAAGAGLDLGLNNYLFAANFNHRMPLAGTQWIEPTVGFSYTRTIWDDATKARGFEDGRELRVQAGARAGSSFNWNSMKVEPTVGLMAYSPLLVEGGTVRAPVGTLTVPGDTGKLFGQLTGKLNVKWTNRFSSYVEGEVRGTEGVLGAGGRFGARYSLQ